MPINQHEYKPTPEAVDYMLSSSRMTWSDHNQRFSTGGLYWEACIGVCPDGQWKARYHLEGRHGETVRSWDSDKFPDPITCLIHAKLANWGELHGNAVT